MASAAAKVLSKTGADLTPKLTGAIKERIKELILGGTVVLFSKSYCPYCTKVKKLFCKLGVVDEVSIELDEDVDGPAMQAALLEVTGQRTVPCVFVGGQHVGGNDDAQAAAKSGKLQKMLAACR
jgi:glutaredoxin 3